MSVMQQALVFNTAGGLTTPFSLDLSTAGAAADYTSMGFTLGTLSNAYDPDSPVAPNYPTTDNTPTAGQPTPFGGYYFSAFRATAGTTRVLTLPSGLVTNRMTGWYAVGSTGVVAGFRIVYDDATYTQVAGANFSSLVLFSQFAVTNPPWLPSNSDPNLGKNIVGLDVYCEGFAYMYLADLTFFLDA